MLTPHHLSALPNRGTGVALAGGKRRPLSAIHTPAAGPSPFCRARAFTLVELIVVMAVILILIAIVTPAVVPILRSSQMNAAGSMLVDELAFARQTALSLNRDVEFRVYQLPSKTDANDRKFRAFQCFSATGNGTVKTSVGNLKYLPEPVVISNARDKSGNMVSTLLDYANPSLTGLTSSQDTVPSVGSPVPYVSFLFRANGGTNLAPVTPVAGSTTGNWYFTLYLDNAPKNTTTGIPDNYFTAQIDAVTGRTRVFRP